MELIRVGISACLLGQEVRYDGGHKRDPFLADILGPRVEWVPVCPEVEMGLGTPREPMKLVRGRSSARLITIDTGIDYTDAMNRWAEERLDELARADLDGYVLKSKSPSCGMDVEVFPFTAPTPSEKLQQSLAVARANESWRAEADPGLFAAALMKRMPRLPLEEESRLSDADLCERFIERMFEYRRSKRVVSGRRLPPDRA